MRSCYLLTTEHLEDGLWFREEEDFKVGMNYVAIEACRHIETSVLAFILMSNHVHFVLGGSREEVTLFLLDYKRRYSLYLRKKYGADGFLRRNKLDVREIPAQEEAFERAIAYVQMNSVAANICLHPSQYPWGTGNVFFNPRRSQGVPISQISRRALIKIVRSNFTGFPAEWKIGAEGYIIPDGYVNAASVERLFRTPGRMDYFLKTSSKVRRRIEAADSNLPAFRDQAILGALPDLCRSLFRKGTFAELSPGEQTEFIRQIRYRFSADVNQIARVCGLTYAEAARKIDGE